MLRCAVSRGLGRRVSAALAWGAGWPLRAAGGCGTCFRSMRQALRGLARSPKAVRCMEMPEAGGPATLAGCADQHGHRMDFWLQGELLAFLQAAAKVQADFDVWRQGITFKAVKLNAPAPPG